MTDTELKIYRGLTKSTHIILVVYECLKITLDFGHKINTQIG